MALKTTTDKDAIMTRHYQKTCQCGCGVVFGTNRPYAKFASPACRVRANRDKQAGMPKMLLGVDLSVLDRKQVTEVIRHIEEIQRWEKAQKSNDIVVALLGGLMATLNGDGKRLERKAKKQAKKSKKSESGYNQIGLKI